jgi:hypothetical protein
MEKTKRKKLKKKKKKRTEYEDGVDWSRVRTGARER